MNDSENPNYYAVIPADVRYDKNLKDKAKLLYGEITCLSNKKGYCYASNKYFADLYGVNNTTISSLISNLVDNGYITREIIYKEGTKEIKDRYLKISQYPYYEKSEYPYYENSQYPIMKNQKDNNINNNNTSNNNIPSVSSLKNSETSPTGEEFLNSNKNHIPIIESGNCSELNNSFEENNNVDSFQVGSKATKEKISNLKLQEDIETKFEWFYKEYPRKVSKAKTRDWFVKNKPCDELMENIAYGLKKYKEDNEKTDKQYIKHPITWLNQRIWEDYL